MRILDGLLIFLGVAIGWTADKREFWFVLAAVAYIPLIILSIQTAERIAIAKAAKREQSK